MFKRFVARIFHQTGPQLERKSHVYAACGLQRPDPICTVGLRGCWRAICGHFASPLRTNRTTIGLARQCKLARNSHAITPRSGAISGLAFALLMTVAFQTRADTWPSKPITLIVTFPPGAAADIVARAMAAKMSATLGKQVIVDNRAGAGGSIGVNTVAKAAPDGYTLGLAGSGAFTILPHLMNLPYAPAKDFAFITLAATAPQVVAVSAKSGLLSMQDLLAAAKKSPGKLNYGSAGNGTSTHLAAELFKKEAGIDLTHVPYKGAAPAITDLVGGQVDVFVGDLAGVLGFAKNGTVKVLAVNSQRRSSLVPDVPTTTELGLPKVISETNYGLIAPQAVPQDILQKLQQVAVQALKSQEVVDTLARQGVVAVGSTADEYRAVVSSESAKWLALVKSAAIKMD